MSDKEKLGSGNDHPESGQTENSAIREEHLSHTAQGTADSQSPHNSSRREEKESTGSESVDTTVDSTSGVYNYEDIPFDKGIRTKHTVMGILGLPIAIIMSIASMIGVMVVVLPMYWGELSASIDDLMTGNLSQSELTQEVSNIIINAGEFLTIATIFQFLAFFATVLLAQYVVSGRSVSKIFSPSTYRGFFAKFGIPKRLDKKVWKHIGIGVALGAGLWGLLQLIGYLVLQASGETLSSDTSSMIADSGSWLLLLFVVPFLGPIVEELFFRGYVLGFLTYPDPKNSTRAIGALIFSSVIFALMHFQGLSSVFDTFVLIWTFTLGLVFGFTYLKTGSLTIALSSHIVYNSITSLMIAIPLLTG